MHFTQPAAQGRCTMEGRVVVCQQATTTTSQTYYYHNTNQNPITNLNLTHSSSKFTAQTVSIIYETCDLDLRPAFALPDYHYHYRVVVWRAFELRKLRIS